MADATETEEPEIMMFSGRVEDPALKSRFISLIREAEKTFKNRKIIEPNSPAIFRFMVQGYAKSLGNPEMWPNELFNGHTKGSFYFIDVPVDCFPTIFEDAKVEFPPSHEYHTQLESGLVISKNVANALGLEGKTYPEPKNSRLVQLPYASDMPHSVQAAVPLKPEELKYLTEVMFRHELLRNRHGKPFVDEGVKINPKYLSDILNEKFHEGKHVRYSAIAEMMLEYAKQPPTEPVKP